MHDLLKFERRNTMTIQEVRNHKEYALAFKKIKAYKKGFEFTLNYARIPTPQANALKIVMRDAIEQGYLESIAIGLSLEGEQTDETFRKIKDAE
jgi:hypothetical protein